MRLNQITAFASDLPASIAFYEMLGLKLIVRSERYARFELPRGEATFSLHQAEGAIPRENAPVLYFECLDVDFEVRRLKHAGVAIEQEPQAQPWLWYEAALRDPAGNAIRLFNAGDARRYPPWRLDPAPGRRNLTIIMLDEGWKLVKRAEGWKAEQDFPDNITSLGPFDLYDLLAMLEEQWPNIFLEREEAIRAFVVSDDVEMAL